MSLIGHILNPMAIAIKSKIVLLGTGTPNADPDRSGPSVAIIVGGSSYLVDFGPGVVRRAAAAAKQGMKSLEPKNLSRAFLTHLTPITRQAIPT